MHDCSYLIYNRCLTHGYPWLQVPSSLTLAALLTILSMNSSHCNLQLLTASSDAVVTLDATAKTVVMGFEHNAPCLTVTVHVHSVIGRRLSAYIYDGPSSLMVYMS